jgi:hypothetical protein
VLPEPVSCDLTGLVLKSRSLAMTEKNHAENLSTEHKLTEDELNTVAGGSGKTPHP